MSDSLRPHRLHSPWNSPGQISGVGSLSLLQQIFPTQGSNAGLLHCRWILYQLSHKGRPRTLEWVAYPFSSRSSQPRNWTRVSCIAGRFFTNWNIREAHFYMSRQQKLMVIIMRRDSVTKLFYCQDSHDVRHISSLVIFKSIWTLQNTPTGLVSWWPF